MKAKILILSLFSTVFFSATVIAQPVELSDIRWQSESKVRAMLGDPQSIRGPVGTHATYTLWQYDGYVVAFANQRAFHLFDENSLGKKMELEESR